MRRLASVFSRVSLRTANDIAGLYMRKKKTSGKKPQED